MLGPTHEEFFTLLVKDLYSSYKDLPLWIYQIQTKFRDEQRPRAGLLRGREFVMKDSYSFDVDDAGLDRSYAAHRDAYIRIFDRLGLDYVIVSALSGAMGGSKSEEFLTPAEVGEDTYVRCTTCDYAANVEALRTLVPPVQPYDDVPAAHVEDTPDTPTIETLVALANSRDDLRRDDREWTAGDTLKNVVVKLRHARGQDRAARHRPCPATARSTPSGSRPSCTRRSSSRSPRRTSRPPPGLVRGYIGPAALGADKPAGVRYLLDPRVVEGTRWITGANEPGRHVFDLVAGRDFTGDGTIEAASVFEGDPCPNDDGGTLVTARGIEMGHIFQLGRKFADALDLKVLDENGKQAGRHDGLLRHRAVPRDRRDRRGDPRRHRPVLAARRGAGRRAPRRDRQGRHGVRGRAGAGRRPGGAGARPSSTTTGAASRPA